MFHPIFVSARKPMPGRNLILVFAKLPRPGSVKTRMLGALSPREAAKLHEACLRDTLRMAGAVRDAEPWLLLAATPHSMRRFARQLALGAPWHAGTQGRGDLGQRLARAFRQGFRRGARKVLAVGTDSPWVGTARIREAFAALECAEVVLGPTDDGGYYLIGARKFLPQLFKEIPWGTSRVLARTTQMLEKTRTSCRLLRREFDLDRPADMRRAERLLRKKRIPCPALKQWFAAQRTKADASEAG